MQLSNYRYLNLCSSYDFILLLYRRGSMDERNEIKKKLKTTKRDDNLAISQVDNTVDSLSS